MLNVDPFVYISGFSVLGSYTIDITIGQFSRSDFSTSSLKNNIALSCDGSFSFSGSDMETSISDRRIVQLFKYCRDSFGAAGVNISFPEGTNPKLTYKWRYLNKFAMKVDSWQIDDETVIVIIGAIVKYAKANNQLNKGLALLFSDKILDVGYEALKKSEANITTICNNIELMHGFFRSSDMSVIDAYLTRKISSIYISISKRCCDEMIKLSQNDRKMLPSGVEVIQTRAKISCNGRLKNKLKLIMKEDFNVD